MAMAEKHLAGLYNRPNFEVVNNSIWRIIGDACLQEGIGLVAESLAVHSKQPDVDGQLL